jgi:nucleoredoxin
MAFKQLFGVDQLQGKTGSVDVASLEGKTVLLYFSAHWCPPCRGFTPKLAEWYKKHATGKNFEIVFVSSDKGQSEFDEYFAEHPWLALPFEHRDAKAALSKKCKVNGIPSLCVFGPDGELITTKGREGVSGDPECTSFPWKPKTYAEIMEGAEIVDKEGNKVTLAGKVHGLYFSAHWCPPCRGFTPKLAECYKKLKAAGKDFEIVFVSSDRDQASFDEYYGGEHPWAQLPFSDRDRKKELSDTFDVEGIPTLVMLDENGKIITTEGTSAVGGDPEGAEFPWYPKPLNDLSAGPGAINDVPSLVVFCDGADDATKAKVKADMDAVAKEHWAECEAKGEDKKFAFFTANSTEGIAGRVRDLTKVSQSGNNVKVVMVDIPAGGKHFHSDLTSTSTEALKGFMASYNSAPSASLGSAPSA